MHTLPLGPPTPHPHLAQCLQGAGCAACGAVQGLWRRHEPAGEGPDPEPLGSRPGRAKPSTQQGATTGRRVHARAAAPALARSPACTRPRSPLSPRPPTRAQDCVIIGGVEQQSQAKQLARRPHVVIATPGRLAELIDTDSGLKKGFSKTRCALAARAI